MSRRQAGEPLTAETARAQDEPLRRPRGDAVADDREEEVGNRELRLGRRSRPAQERDLVRTEQGTQEDVADAAVWQMHDFREHRVRALGLLQTEMLLDAGAQSAVSVAEAAEEAGTRCTARAAEKHAEAAVVELVLRSGGDGGHHLERIRQPRLLWWRERIDLRQRKLELSPPVAKRFADEMQE